MAQKKQKLTIRDIAKQANVSYQTVSRVINNSEDVAEETRKRVLKTMRELDFQPSKAAQILSTKRSNTLELIYVDVIYGGRLADSTKDMAQVAEAHGYSLLVSVCTSEALGVALNRTASRFVDGIIMHAPRLHIEDETLLELCNGIPLVRRDYVPESRLAWVGFDQVYATRLAVEHIIQLGHQQIAAIPPESGILNGYWRYTAWKNILLELGLTPGPCCPGDYSMDSGYRATQVILESGQPFTAIVVGTDNMALGVIHALREYGLRVPQDISIVSYDNTEMSAHTDPPLTSVDFKFLKQEEMAVKYLIELIADPEMELHQRVLMPGLVVRESTRALRT